ncbi:hypothetical protein FB567DRAFT_546453 [Paraphoma chrysanthemicola]|uniref:Uncharacterized protein n=1 Tax=Paraphoma chrysanthemicola TaxID=798071 RepID=A0A8K0RAB1_9PLEO|nr:hypothetical protein FB567DRAFT_546453 [Paraphoma chrysanthemicola]
MALDPPELYFRAAATSSSTSTSSSATITTRTTSPTPSSRASLSASTPSASAIVDDNGQSLSPGAIVGIVIGVILGLLLVLGGLYFMRRRTLRHKAQSGNVEDSLPELLLSNKPAGGNEKRAYQSDKAHFSELNDTGRPHELDPSQAQLLANTSWDETRLVESGSERGGQQGDVIPAQDGNLVGSVERQADPSFHVQAQKKREVEWLEMEEARLRQRREQLLHGGNGTG